MDSAESWVYSRISTMTKPKVNELDCLSEQLALQMETSIPLTYKRLQSTQLEYGLNVTFFIASVLYFAEDSKWKKNLAYK